MIIEDEKQPLYWIAKIATELGATVKHDMLAVHFYKNNKYIGGVLLKALLDMIDLGQHAIFKFVEDTIKMIKHHDINN